MGKVKNKIIRLIKRTNILQFLIKVIYRMASMLPIRKNTIVFESFLGKQFSDSPKAIYEYIKDNYSDYKLYWSFDRKTYLVYKETIHSVPRLSIKWIFVMARAEYWVTNSRLPIWIPKRKDTIYIQTWHGTPLKKLGVDIEEVHLPGTTTEKYKKEFIHEASKWDYLLSANNYSTDIFRRAFAYDKKVIDVGYPRNDILYNWNNDEKVAQLKKKLGVPFDKKIILYAPTWRDDDYHGIGAYKFNLKIDVSLMKEVLGEDYIILLRTHYLIADSLNLEGYEDFVYDFSHYSDISHLYLISDILVTDYSSVFFDYANLQRPIIFFVYDIEKYRDNLRGFYLDFEHVAPGPFVKTTEKLIKEIKRYEGNDFTISGRYKTFLEEFCYLDDGNASRRVVNSIFNDK